ncbi:aquaporin-like [Colias croceus]|uniref:aquaporin-like n=1 Tax=Colias crocea TaxID=72248 RepID=UPI001E281950|nr:aquaporin-like [Colias croceus]
MSVNAQLVGLTEVEIEKIPIKTVLWKTLNWRAIVAEFVATMMLVSLGCMTCIPHDGSVHQPMYGPLGFGLIVLFNIQTFAHISGAHMNPVVTLAAMIWGQVSILLGIMYIIVQCAGAIIGYGILVALSPSGFVEAGVCTTTPLLKYTIYQAIGIEVMLTAALVFITCAVWDPVNKDNQESNSVKFGLTIAGLSLAGGPLTGASMNPARSLGPALWTSTWKSHWIYWLGPFLGGIFASVFYKYVWLKVDKIKPDILTWPDSGEGLTKML